VSNLPLFGEGQRSHLSKSSHPAVSRARTGGKGKAGGGFGPGPLLLSCLVCSTHISFWAFWSSSNQLLSCSSAYRQKRRELWNVLSCFDPLLLVCGSSLSDLGHRHPADKPGQGLGEASGSGGLTSRQASSEPDWLQPCEGPRWQVPGLRAQGTPRGTDGQ